MFNDVTKNSFLVYRSLIFPNSTPEASKKSEVLLGTLNPPLPASICAYTRTSSERVPTLVEFYAQL